MEKLLTLFVLSATYVLALPTDPIIKLDSEVRYGLVPGPDGRTHIADLWLTVEGLKEVARYEPNLQNQYHLFTRANPTVSQPLLINNPGLLGLTNYSPNKRTIFIIHGWLDSAISELNAVLVPAFLETYDVNVIVVDWQAGAGTINYAAAVTNTHTSGAAVANFINWLLSASNGSPDNVHIVGHSLGGHQAGIAARYVAGNVNYVTALDPAWPGWITNDNKFSADDALYTEVIHTNAGLLGYLSDIGDVDFYPNGGVNMPGCDSQECDHARCYYYFAESIRSGGFTGRRCLSYVTAMSDNCILSGSLQMGGIFPKFGSSGIYYVDTNAVPPFSRG